MKFSYKARTKEGKVQRGTIEASSRKGALAILEKYGLYVTSLRQTSEKAFFIKEFRAVKKVSQKDIVLFTRQFGVMLKSAVPPIEALKAQVAQTESAGFREEILKMAEAIETGNSLSQAFSMYPKIFNPFFISIIKSGEATGKVADSLSYLADHLERDYNFRQKVRGAMIYPAFVVVVFVAAFFLVTFFVVPKLSEILTAFTGELPMATKAMLFLAGFVRKGGWILIIVILIVLFFLPQYMKRSRYFKRFYDKTILKLPILGDFFKKVYLARFAENLSVLIAAGLPITHALKITEEIIESSVYKNILKIAGEKVTRGEKLSTILNIYPKQVPSFVTQMISTGETTGRLEETLMDIVNFYQQAIERTTDNLTTILEPILILVLGIGIAILAVSIFIPLFKIGMGGFAP